MLSFICHSVSVCFFLFTWLFTTQECQLSHYEKASLHLSKSSEILMLFFTDYLFAAVPTLNVAPVMHARRQ